MNFIILNGKKSTLIEGLIIQSLPHISKPLVRTEIEEIDGRDGDIITKLGYSAYDKEMLIGLYGDFDINEVIQYFDSEGQVIFSNELDKYYNYQIIEQIDFERLVRYRTATVTMHVQPFKYSAVDKPIEIENKLNIANQTMESNGITLSVTNNVISIAGTATDVTEIYLPIDKMSLESGRYTLNADIDGQTSNGCYAKLINGLPIDSKSFGGTFLPLSHSSSLTSSIDDTKTYDYLWFYILSGASLDISVEMALTGNQIRLHNFGNIFAKPVLTIYGLGMVNVTLNGKQIFTINMTTPSITIDAQSLEAYTGNTLLNRNVIGDYNDLALIKGRNDISWTGNVSQVSIDKYSRWI